MANATETAMSSSNIPVNVAGTVIPLSNKVKILGATLDSNLTMDNHTKSRHNLSFGSRAFHFMHGKIGTLYHLKFASYTPYPHLETV